MVCAHAQMNYCWSLLNFPDQKILLLNTVLNYLGPTILVIFRDMLMFDKVFVSPQVKRIVIISNKHGIYELPHELPNDLRLRSQNFIEL